MALAADPSRDSVFDVAARLTGARVDAVEQVGGGRNSRVFRVRGGAGDFALKHYPSRAADPRDRLGTEVLALGLMERGSFHQVPRVIAADAGQGFALLSWLDGQPVTVVTEADIDQAMGFLRAIHGMRGPEAFPAERLASEACLAGREIERQIEARLARLRALPAEERGLRHFLDTKFAAARARLLGRARRLAEAAGFDVEAELAWEFRSLVPADFGFHNALRRPDGSLAFLDFEYFGWDDPVKLTADIMLHPGTPLEPPLVERFRRQAEVLYGSDPAFRARLNAYLPLFGLRWVLILLNEFLPERWQARLHAGAVGDWDNAKRRQLERASSLLARIEGADG